MKNIILTALLCLLLTAMTNAQESSTNGNPATNKSTETNRKVVFRATKKQITAVQEKLKSDGIFGGERDQRRQSSS